MAKGHRLRHSPYIVPLIEKEDWAQLLLYWVSHGLLPTNARDAARQILYSKLKKDPIWEPVFLSVTEFIQNPVNRSWTQPKNIPPLLLRDRIILRVLEIFPNMALCQSFQEFEPSEQNKLLEIGSGGAAATRNLAFWLEESPLFAYCGLLEITALYKSNQFKTCESKSTELIPFYRELSESRPEIYSDSLAASLNIAALSLYDMNTRHNEALDLCEEALKLSTPLQSGNEQFYNPRIA